MTMHNNIYLKKLDDLCRQESEYYLNSIDLVAASSFLRPEVAFLTQYPYQRAMEGLLNKRPYAGTKFHDEIESIGVEAAKRLFQAEASNIQPHSCSQANQITYLALLNPGDKALALRFDAGGHLTHGNKINFSGRFYHFDYYGIDEATQTINYEKLREKAHSFLPKLIIAGASSYPRIIDYQRIGEIAKEIDAYFMADIAHPAGLIAAGLYPSPVPFADVVTTTMAKTLGGANAGVILSKQKFESIINKAVHPGMQSSVPINRLVQVCLTLLFAETDEFKECAKQIIQGAKIFEQAFSHIPNTVLFGGTDSHFIVINTLSGFGLTGREAEAALEQIGIFTNRQVIPWEQNKVYEASGLRIGTSPAAQRGFKEKDFELMGQIIIEKLQNPNNHSIQNKLKKEVNQLIQKNIAENHHLFGARKEHFLQKIKKIFS